MGPLPSNRITMQYLELSNDYSSSEQRDAHFTGHGTQQPLALILDFVYGVAAYNRWGVGQDIKKAMQNRFTEHLNSIPILPDSTSSDSENSPESDDNDDDEYTPPRQPRGRNHASEMSNEMLRSMENVLRLSAFMKGTTPEGMAAEIQRQEEAEELRAKKASKMKVEEWTRTQLESSPPCVISYLRFLTRN